MYWSDGAVNGGGRLMSRNLGLCTYDRVRWRELMCGMYDMTRFQ